MKYPKFNDVDIDEKIAKNWHRIIKRILDLPFDETPKVVPLSASAKALFKEWYDKLAYQKNCGGSSFAGIATKMDRYCGRLALGLEVMKYGCKESKLEENGNGLPEFDLDLVTAFLVKEKISPRGMEARRYAIEQGYLVEENEGKTDIENEKLTSKTDIVGQTRPEFPTQVIKNVYNLIRMNPKVKYSQMEDNLGVTERTIARAVDWLKENGYINSERSKIKGEWQLL